MGKWTELRTWLRNHEESPSERDYRAAIHDALDEMSRLDLAHPTPATEATGELCPYSFLWPDEPPDAERRCRAPQIPGATRCVNADRYNERCRLLVHPTPSVPDDWGPVRELPCVRCPKCGFQFAAEHRCHDGTYRCPECGEGRCAHPTPSAEATEGTDGIEPGTPIASTDCPCCGAHLEIEHGDDPGEIACIGTAAAPMDPEDLFVLLRTPMRPRIVCLCGSTRFYTEFQRANYERTMAGEIVLSVGFYPHSQEQAHGQQIGCTPEQKEALDALYLRKIDLCDHVYVLNVNGYIGSSTRKEIEYAEKIGKPVEYLEPLHGGGKGGE